MPTLHLIDGSGYIYRAYFALPHLSTSRGQPTNAVYGFTTMLLKALREGDPSHVAVVWDRGTSGRAKHYAEYKANRPAVPDDLAPQIPYIRKVVEALRVPSVELAGHEADDVIATLTRKARERGMEVVIVTGDKDFCQLVDGGIRMYDPMYDKWYGRAEVEEKWGVPPEQMVELQALLGDEIDNIPGVPGVGPKTAAALVRQFGSVHALLARAHEIAKPKLRESVMAHRESIRMARKLVELASDLPLDVDPESLVRRPIDEAAVRQLFTELEFSRLLKDLPPPPPSPPPPTTVVRDEEGLRALVARLAGEPSIALRAATDGPRAPPAGLALAVRGEAWYVPLPAERPLDLLARPTLPLHRAREILRPLLEAARPGKRGHGMKQELLSLSRLGIELAGVEADTELMSYLLNPTRKNHLLGDIAREQVGTELAPVESVLGEGRKKVGWAEAPEEAAAAHLGAGAEACFRLADRLRERLVAESLWELYETIEAPLMPILARMERVGVRLDVARLRALGGELERELDKLLADIYRLAGHEFNVNSNPQLNRVLYEEMGLPVQKRGRTGPSTDHEVLEKLAETHEIARRIVEYRELWKLKTTYVDALPSLVDPRDGRLHTTFQQTVTATGRLSSVEPNLQNIPIRSEVGKKIREAFVAEDGWWLLALDYSQIELRLLAHVSGDPALRESFARGEDVHARTAAEVFGVPPEAVTSEQRRIAKMVNFGIAYGLSAYGLASRLDLPGKEAQAIIDRYFERYARVREWLDVTIEQARRTGEVRTLFGRRRYIPDILSRNPAARQAAERTAVNMPIQGTAADLIKKAMIDAERSLRDRGLCGRMLLQVHDELLFEVPQAELATTREVVRAAMEGAAKLDVPLVVDGGEGRTWAEAS